MDYTPTNNELRKFLITRGLTNREVDVFELLVVAKLKKSTVARLLYITEKTLEIHIKRIELKGLF